MDFREQISKSVTRSLKKQPDDLKLERGSQSFRCKGVWEREDGASSVAIIQKSGDLGTIRPMPGDHIVWKDKRMLVVGDGGFDDVYSILECGPALLVEPRDPAPDVSLRHPRPDSIEVLFQTIVVAKKKVYLRRATESAYRYQSLLQHNEHLAYFGDLPLGVWVAGAYLINAEGKRSDATESIVVLPI